VALVKAALRRVVGDRVILLCALSVVIAAALLAALNPLLRVRPAPARVGIQTISFVRSVPSWRPGRGPEINVEVHVKDCDHPPVVTGTVGDTDEFSRDRAATLRRKHRVAIAVHDTTGPIKLDIAGSTQLRVTQRQGIDGATVAIASVSNWDSRRDVLTFSFEGSGYLSPRSVGTCYLELPDLTGGGADETGGEGLIEVFDFKEPPFGFGGTYAATLGQVEVVTDGQVDVGLSVPPPDDFGSFGPVWTCYDDAVAEALTARPPPHARVATPPAASPSCNVQAVIKEPNFDVKNNLALLALGGLIGVLVSLLVDLMLEYVGRQGAAASRRRKRRREKPSSR